MMKSLLVASSLVFFGALYGQENLCDFSTDFSSATGWTVDDRPTTGRVSIGYYSTLGLDGVIFNNATGGPNVTRVYTPTPFRMNDTWKVSGEFYLSAMGTADPNQGISHVVLGLTESTLEMLDDIYGSPTVNDLIAITASGSTNDGMRITMVTSLNGTTNFTSIGNYGYIQLAVRYRYYLERLSSTQYHIAVEKVSNSDTVVSSYYSTASIMPRDFNYIQIGNNPRASFNRSMSGWVGNLCIENGSDLSLPTVDVNSWSTYPNPAHDNFSIEGLTQPGTMRLVDLTGRTVLQRAFAGEDELKVSVNNIPAGVYAIRLEFDSGALSTRKIVINR